MTRLLLPDANCGAVFGLYGAGGHGREVMPLWRKQIEVSLGMQGEFYFVDDAERVGLKVNGIDVISHEAFVRLDRPMKYFNVAIGNSALREKVVLEAIGAGLIPKEIRSESVVELDNSSIGQGAMLSQFVTISSNVVMGNFIHVNAYCFLAHDCVIGDFVTFAPGVRCNGNVHVENHAYIGSGALIRNGAHNAPVRIGRNAVVGMGAVVLNDVPDGATVVGNPARIISAGSNKGLL